MEPDQREEEPSRPRRLMRVMAGIAFSFTAVVGLVMINLPPTDSKVQAMIEAAIVKMEGSIRPTLPKNLDQLATLVAVDHAGNTIRYEMTVDLSKTTAKPTAAFASQVRSPMLRAICSSEAAQILKLGASYEYIYRDQNSNDLGRFTVLNSDCQGQ